MLRNYFLTALRNFQRHRVFSALNLLGLTVGLATVLLIALFVVNELSYDRYNAFADRIYRVDAHFRIGGENMNEKLVPADLGPAMVRDFPYVQSYARLHDAGQPTAVRKGDAWITETRTCWADATLFKVFSLPTLAGDPQTALTQPYAVVISASMAARHFGGLPASAIIGKTLQIDDTTSYTVTAVIKDMPVLSHIHFDLIRSLCTQPDSREVNWINNDWVTFLLVKPGVSGQQLDKDLALEAHKYTASIFQKQLGTTLEEMEKKGDFYRYLTLPLTRIHLYSDLPHEIEPSGNIVYVRMFVIVALFILLLACVNFMNLSTARSAGRSREVGVRKVLGSRRGHLVLQFLSESVLLSVGAMVLAIALVSLILPYFSRLSGQPLTLAMLPWSWLVPAALGGSVLVGLLAGSYPSFFLSSFQPIDVLKGKLASGFKGGWLRNALVVFQFTIAVILITSTLVIFRQLSYIRNSRLGYDRSQILLIHHTSALGDNARVFKTALEQLVGTSAITTANSFPTSNLSLEEAWMGDAARTRPLGPDRWRVDANYIPLMKMTMAQGRSFRADMPSDSQSIVINETMARLLGPGNPVNQKMYNPQSNGQMIPYTIIGVVKDFHSASLHQKTPAILMTLGPDGGGEVITAVRLSTNNIQSAIERVQHLYTSLAGNSPQPFEYSFMDEDFNNLYTSESRVGQIFSVFTGLAILIACLGLFGLITFAAEQRKKEMSIRKVLGAGVSHIVFLLARDFTLLILIALAIAFPVAWWGMHQWLETFVYRTAIGVDTFVWAGLATLAAVVVTIGHQALRTAMAKPVDSLKTE